MTLIEANLRFNVLNLDDLDKYQYDPNCQFCITNGETQTYNFTNFFNHHSISIPANQWLTDSEIEEVANKIIKNITSEDLNL